MSTATRDIDKQFDAPVDQQITSAGDEVRKIVTTADITTPDAGDARTGDSDHAESSSQNPVDQHPVDEHPVAEHPRTTEEHDQLSELDLGDLGELEWVDPRKLIIGANYRDPRLTKATTADIKDRGVRDLIAVRRTDNGGLVVRRGQRRTLSAIEAGLTRVRVFIEPGPVPTEDDKAGQVDRIIDQLGENTHRLGHTDQELVNAHQQLLDLGLSAGQIARRTKAPRAQVKLTTTIARSETASALMDSHPTMSLEHLAVIGELSAASNGDDDTEAVTVLTEVAATTPAQFAHTAQKIRDRRQDAAMHSARVAELTAAGTRVVNPDPASEDVLSEHGTKLQSLRPADTDSSGTELTVEAHASCPGHAAYIEVLRFGGAPEPTVRTVYLCTDPDAHGHTSRYGSIGSGAPAGDQRSGPKTDAEKADLRCVRRNNTDWESATTVRIDWLTTFLRSKTAPRNAARFVAATLASGSHDLRRAMEGRHPLAHKLLDLGSAPAPYSPDPSPVEVAIATATPQRLTVLNLALILAAHEAGTTRNSWRSPTDQTRRYFAALQEWNYPLSPVEQLVNGIDTDADGTDSDAEQGDEHQAGDGDGSDEDVDAESKPRGVASTEPTDLA